MNKLTSALLATAVISLCASAQAGTIGEALRAQIEEQGSAGKVPVIIKFDDTVNLKMLRRDFAKALQQQYPDPKERKLHRNALKRAMLAYRLQDKASNSQQPLLQLLEQRGEKGKTRSLWAINALASSVSADIVADIAALPGVKSVSLDAVVQGPGPSTAPVAPTNWNLPAIGAPDIWSLGHAGLGVVVATMDTGVDASHPDLAPGYRGGANSWFDPYGQNATPVDFSGHGTQVLGLIVGGASGGYQIGVAPDAQWIAAKIFNNANEATMSGIHAAYQWMLDPDNDPATNDSPDIVNNSWVLASMVGECNQEFSGDIALLKEAEIAVIFSGGNFGSKSNTSVSPANDTGSLAVGSVDDRLKVARTSSRGPSACDGGIYPRLVAPGEGILTSQPMPALYNVVSGTSFSVAHVSGAMAVLKGAFPTATITELETAMISTATDLGDGGPDSSYGYGLLNMAGAYDSLVGGSVPDPGSLAFSSASYSIAEDVAALSVTVTRSGGTSGDISVDFTTTDGSATAGSDYSSAVGTLNFLDGETSQSFSVSIIDDTSIEGDETFDVALANPTGGASLGSQDTAIVSITDNDAAPPPASTIQITRATYSRDQLVVRATSDLGSAADLSATVELDSGGLVTLGMAWNARKSLWEISVKRFSRSYGAAPVFVTVSGTEGEVSSGLN